MDVPQVGRVEVPRWVNTRTVIGVLLFCVSFLGAQRLLAVEDGTKPVWVLGRSLSSGETITSSDLRVGQVALPPDQAGLYAAQATDLIGAVAVRPIAEGEMIPLSSVAVSIAGGTSRVMTVPIEIAHAVGGDLRVGDVVDVFATFDTDGGRARTVTVASSVEVARVVTAGGLVGEESAIGVTVSVSADQAARLVFALRTGVIDVVKVAAPSEASTRTVSSADM